MPFVNIEQNDVTMLQLYGNTIRRQHKIASAEPPRLKVSHYPKPFGQVSSILVAGRSIAFVNGDSRECRVTYDPVARTPLSQFFLNGVTVWGMFLEGCVDTAEERLKRLPVFAVLNQKAGFSGIGKAGIAVKVSDDA